MELGIVGLGRMGGNVALRPLRGGHRVAGRDRAPAASRALEEAIPAPVLTASLHARFRSRQASAFGERPLSAMRRQRGGHAEATRGGALP